MDYSNVLASYGHVIMRLIKLATGQYPRVDAYYKHFYSFFKQHPDNTVQMLNEMGSWLLPEDEAEQILLWTFHKTIRKYYSPAGKRHRSKKYSLDYLLHQRGTLALVAVILKRLRQLKMETDYYLTSPRAVPALDSEPLLSDFQPSRLLHKGDIPFKLKVFAYKILVEGKGLKELQSEFGGNWSDITRLVARLRCLAR